MKTIIISAVNLTEWGPLAILQECLAYLSSSQISKVYEVIAIVHDKRLCHFSDIKYIEIPEAKKSWIKRLYHELFFFRKLSDQHDPYLWLSLHDITPNVMSARRAVYCHNASPFYRLRPHEFLLSPRFSLFNLFYKYIYAINISRNDYVIVQQHWLRKKFVKLFGIDEDRVIVAHPDTTSVLKNENAAHDFGSDFVFFYPSFPRVFKNHEVICKAVDILNRQKRRDFKVIFTMAGDENRYSRHVHKNYGYLENIVFMPPVKREVIADLYCAADCVIFASKLETWGIPISEAKHFEKPLLLADLEYAHETLGDYDKVRFFRHDDHVGLAGLMKSAMDNEISYEKTASSVISKPFSRNWEELFTILLS